MRYLEYERTLYSGLPIFGGSLFVMNWANQIALSSNAASIAVLAVLGKAQPHSVWRFLATFRETGKLRQ